MVSKTVSRAPESPKKAPSTLEQGFRASDKMVVPPKVAQRLREKNKVTLSFPIKYGNDDVVYLEEEDTRRLNKALKSMARRGFGIYFVCPRCYVSIRQFRYKEPGDKIAECDLCKKRWIFVINKSDHEK